MSQQIDGKQIMALTALFKKVGANSSVLDRILNEPGILLDFMNPNANVGNICRHQLRTMLELPGLIEVQDRISMDLIMSRFDVVEGPLDAKILEKINARSSGNKKELCEFEEVHFSDKISTKKAAEGIRVAGDKWLPFELKHLVFYMDRNHQKTMHTPVVASGQIITIDEKQFVAVAGYERKKHVLYFVPAHGNRWPINTRFPKFRPVVG